MEKIITEYKVESRKDGALLLRLLQGEGADLSLVLPHLDPRCRAPEISHYCVWSDGSVTRGDEKMDLEDVMGGDYRYIEWNHQIPIVKIIR